MDCLAAVFLLGKGHILQPLENGGIGTHLLTKPYERRHLAEIGQLIRES